MPGVNSLPDLNLFLVGAPKCGTTAMFDFLRQHSEIFLPQVKELHFFGLDLEIGPPAENFSTRPRSDEETARYLSFFENATDQPVRGEGSVFYLFSRSAASEIAKACPNSRILIMLRNPIDVISSLHSQYLFDGNESEERVEAALDLAPDRLEGRSIPPGAHFSGGLQYLDVIDFYPQVKRYLEVFGRERVHVTLLEEFSRDNRSEYERVLRFLEVDTGEIPTFRKVNRNKYARSRLLRDLLKRPPDSIRAVGKLLPKGLRDGVRSNLISLNHVESDRLPIGTELRGHLLRELQPSLDKLGELLGRDIREVWAN